MEKQRSKLHQVALSKMISKLLRGDSEERAWKLLRQLKVSERLYPIHTAIDILLYRSHYHLPGREETFSLTSAIEEVSTLPPSSQRDRLWRRLATVAARHGQERQALELADRMDDVVERDYAFSSIIQALTDREETHAALNILPTLQDEGARDDAITSLVLELCREERSSEIFVFIDSLSTIHDRKQAAKVWRSELLAHHQKIEANRLSRHYSLGV